MLRMLETTPINVRFIKTAIGSFASSVPHLSYLKVESLLQTRLLRIRIKIFFRVHKLAMGLCESVFDLIGLA
ncbi:Uncharacterised protein [Vibrio cholerae]|nr:Uncharacterised protein [Vibrio cholerae]